MGHTFTGEDAMLTIYQGEQRNGRVKLTTNRDCLAPDTIRTERVFVDMQAVKTAAAQLEDRGFRVCIDTEDEFYVTPEDFLRGNRHGTTLETVNADARLIAASPDLLEALRVLVDHAQERYPHFESERGQRDIKAALDAIAKATRGQL